MSPPLSDLVIQAVNVAGTDTWSVVYAIVADTAAPPSFSDDPGDAQAWTQNTAITDITVTLAAGNPTTDLCHRGQPSRWDNIQHLYPHYCRHSNGG